LICIKGEGRPAGDIERMPDPMEENRRIAGRLSEAAELLQAQGANPFRVRAYRNAAESVALLERPLRSLFDEGGRAALETLPAIGRGIASSIAEMLITERWSRLERLRGDGEPERIFRSVPGIGPDLARRIHEELHIDTLEALELACRDGRLQRVAGVGPRRALAVSAALTALLDRRRVRLTGPAGVRPAAPPPVALLLAVDGEYREKAQAGALSRIAPRRFNPGAAPWLPVLHTRRGEWHFTALYSNTARAHELKRTRDWVVIYYYDREHAEGQNTVVTEQRGALAGRRVVRGREAECRAHYAGQGTPEAA
jgi:hypothetical protein